MNENKNITHQKYEIMKAVLIGKPIIVNTCTSKKKGESQLSNLTLDINELEKEEKDKQQLRGNNNIIRVLINNTECRNTIESTKLEVVFFEKITELISFR